MTLALASDERTLRAHSRGIGQQFEPTNGEGETRPGHHRTPWSGNRGVDRRATAFHECYGTAPVNARSTTPAGGCGPPSGACSARCQRNRPPCLRIASSNAATNIPSASLLSTASEVSGPKPPPGLSRGRSSAGSAPASAPPQRTLFRTDPCPTGCALEVATLRIGALSTDRAITEKR